ncbi:hypothetical protein AAKU67_001490 [Oxalobacteraceae bacterium GrIS 2.11]
MDKNFIKLGISVGTALLCSSAFADQTLTPIENRPVFSFSSFGTIGAVQTNNGDVLYTTGGEKHGADKQADFGPDTKVGGQLDMKFNQDFSATIQIFSKQNAAGNYNPDVEWAFGKFKVGGGFDLRLGRIGAPFFMTSDFRSVGYTNVSVRTPIDVYALVPVRSFDGGDLLYKTDLGQTTINGQIWMGRSSVLTGRTSAGDSLVELHNIGGINLSAENGPLTLRVGTMKTRLGTEGTGLSGFNSLLGGLNKLSAAPGLSSLATVSGDLAISGKFASFTGVGAVLDLGNWIATGEVVKRTTGTTYIPTVTAWYTTIGYRVDTFTPYVSFSNRHTNSISSVTSPAVSPLLPPVIQGTVPVLIGASNSLLTNTNESTAALGVRWDAGKNYDIKAEYQQVKVPAGSAGLFIFPNSGGHFSSDTRVNVVSLVVDFVF